MTKNRVDIMVDIETLGTKENATIFQIAAMSFNIESGEVYDSVNLIGDISQYPELSVDGDTLKWWLNTNKELLTELLNKGTLSEFGLIVEFNEWLSRQHEDMSKVYLWGNGILFDNKKLQQIMDKTGNIKYPIYYRNDRDVRTLLELTSMKSGLTEKELKDSVTDENEVLHDAFDDIKYQIRLAHKCYSILMK